MIACQIPEGSPAKKLLATDSTITPDFTIRADLKKAKEDNKVTPKYVPNPTADWGPMQRAKGFGRGIAGGMEEKREKGKRDHNQGKKSERKRERRELAAAEEGFGEQERDLDTGDVSKKAKIEGTEEEHEDKA